VRATKNLIDELERTAQGINSALLAVVFPEEGYFTRFVDSNEGTSGEKLARLSELIENGGNPLGFIAIDYGAAREFVVRGWLLQENEKNNAMREFMSGLVESYRKQLSDLLTPPRSIVR
jgi:hypothetical protein